MKIKATKSNPFTIEFFGKPYKFTFSTTATRAAAVAEAIETNNRPRLASLLHETELTGKLEGFCSLSTNTLLNPFCRNMAKCPDNICSRCYAAAELSSGIRRSLAEHLTLNAIILQHIQFTVEELSAAPIAWNQSVYRIESHGETANVTQAINIIRLALSRPRTMFTVWSKNLGAWLKAFQQEGKPDNLIFGQSSFRINTPDTPVSFADFVFTVYEPGKRPGPDEAFQCRKKCRECMKCYRKPLDGGPMIIAEEVK